MMNTLPDHEKQRRWILNAADSAISLSSCARAYERAELLLSAIESAKPIAYESQMLNALQNLNHVHDTPRAREFA